MALHQQHLRHCHLACRDHDVLPKHASSHPSSPMPPPHLARAALVCATKQQHPALAAVQLHHPLPCPALVAGALSGRGVECRVQPLIWRGSREGGTGCKVFRAVQEGGACYFSRMSGWHLADTVVSSAVPRDAHNKPRQGWENPSRSRRTCVGAAGVQHATGGAAVRVEVALPHIQVHLRQLLGAGASGCCCGVCCCCWRWVGGSRRAAPARCLCRRHCRCRLRCCCCCAATAGPA